MTQDTFPNFKGNDHPPQGHPPMGHPEGGQIPPKYYQPKPPKGHKWDPKSGTWVKKHTGRNIFLSIAGVTTGLIVLAALVPNPDSGQVTLPSTTTSSTPRTGSPNAKASKPVEQAPLVTCADRTKRNDPCPIFLGKAFQLGSHRVENGWRVVPGPLGADMGGKATNVGDHTSGMLIEVKFLSGNEVVMDFQCSTDQLEPEQSQQINCLSADEFAEYDRITAEATF